MEEDDGAREGAADVEVEHVGEEELLHLQVQLQLEVPELGLELCVLVSNKTTSFKCLNLFSHLYRQLMVKTLQNNITVF